MPPSDLPVRTQPRRTRLFRGRSVSARVSDADDMKYAYAAWKLGGIALPHFTSSGPTPEEFSASFGAYITNAYQACFTMLARPPGRDSVIPVGIIFGVMPSKGNKIIWIGDFVWFPWASKRNRLETTVHFLNQIRGDQTVLGFATADEIPFFEHVCKYGVSRRVGTVFDMLDAGPAALFQTRKPYQAKVK